ncbi:MAG: hypothetical protein JWP78_3278 [Mucilaginibacter sp.]|nr:hypothetical protein [Mucilaginibacter sp.]
MPVKIFDTLLMLNAITFHLIFMTRQRDNCYSASFAHAQIIFTSKPLVH